MCVCVCERTQSYLLVLLLRELPVVDFELVELIKLQADVLYGELEQVPEASQVLSRGTRVGIHVLRGGNKEVTSCYTGLSTTGGALVQFQPLAGSSNICSRVSQAAEITRDFELVIGGGSYGNPLRALSNSPGSRCRVL